MSRLIRAVVDTGALRHNLKIIRSRAGGARVLGDGEPRLGAHERPVLFLHPKDFSGTLIELEEA